MEARRRPESPRFTAGSRSRRDFTRARSSADEALLAFSERLPIAEAIAAGSPHPWGPGSQPVLPIENGTAGWSFRNEASHGNRARKGNTTSQVPLGHRSHSGSRRDRVLPDTPGRKASRGRGK